MRLRLLMRLVALAFSLFVAPFAARAQPPTKAPHVGVLRPHPSTEPLTVPCEPFAHGRRELGWTRGVSPLIIPMSWTPIWHRRWRWRASRLPVIYPGRLDREAGGLMSSGTNIVGFGPSSASRVRKGGSHGC